MRRVGILSVMAAASLAGAMLAVRDEGDDVRRDDEPSPHKPEPREPQPITKQHSQSREKARRLRQMARRSA